MPWALGCWIDYLLLENSLNKNRLSRTFCSNLKAASSYSSRYIRAGKFSSQSTIPVTWPPILCIALDPLFQEEKLSLLPYHLQEVKQVTNEKKTLLDGYFYQVRLPAFWFYWSWACFLFICIMSYCRKMLKIMGWEIYSIPTEWISSGIP